MSLATWRHLNGSTESQLEVLSSNPLALQIKKPRSKGVVMVDFPTANSVPGGNY